MINSYIGVSSTRAEHKGRLVGSKVRSISVYRIFKRVSWLLLYSQDYQKVFIAINIIFFYENYMICNKANNDIVWRILEDSPIIHKYYRSKGRVIHHFYYF